MKGKTGSGRWEQAVSELVEGGEGRPTDAELGVITPRPFFAAMQETYRERNAASGRVPSSRL